MLQDDLGWGLTNTHFTALLFFPYYNFSHQHIYYIINRTGQLWWPCQTQLLLSLCWSPEASPCVLSVIFTEKGTLQMRGNSPTPTNGNVKLINLKQGNMVKFRSYRVISCFLMKSWGEKENTFVVLQCYLYFKHSDSIFKLPWQLCLMHI